MRYKVLGLRKVTLFLCAFLMGNGAFADLTADQVKNQVENPAFKISFKKKTIQVGKINLRVEIADTDLKRSRGLMFRKSFDGLDGMLFIFEVEEPLAFWMKNTWMPLSIGYFDAKGRLLNVEEMEPAKSEMQAHYPSYPSIGSAKYALEMPSGWFRQRQIKQGTILKLK